jgi:hypothetical protein
MRSACSSNGTTHSSGTINKRQHANRIDADALRFAGRPSTRERTRSTDDPPHRGNVTDSDHEPSPPIRSRRTRLADRTLPKHASGSSTVDPTQPRGPHSRARTGLSRPETRLPVVLHVALAMRDRRPRGRFRRNTHMPFGRAASAYLDGVLACSSGWCNRHKRRGREVVSRIGPATRLRSEYSLPNRCGDRDSGAAVGQRWPDELAGAMIPPHGRRVRTHR